MQKKGGFRSNGMEGFTISQYLALLALSSVIAENNRREAEAVQGYTEQLKRIKEAQETFADVPDVLSALGELEEETREKIADELNHSVSLNEEYTALTGIAPKEE